MATFLSKRDSLWTESAMRAVEKCLQLDGICYERCREMPPVVRDALYTEEHVLFVFLRDKVEGGDVG